MQGRHYTQLEREGDRLVAQGAFEQARQAYAAALDLRPSTSWIATKLARLEMPVVAQAAPTRLNLFVHAPPSPDPRCATALRHCLEGHVASGLFARQSELSMVQAEVGMVTITLFVPCIASLMLIVKEQGMRVAALMLAMIIPTAFLVGGLLNHGLRLFF